MYERAAVRAGDPAPRFAASPSAASPSAASPSAASSASAAPPGYDRGLPPPGLAVPGEIRVAAPMMTPGEVPALLLANLPAIAAAAAACLLAALAFLLVARPSYVASTQVLVDPVALRVTEDSLRAPNALGDTQIAEVENDVRLMTSVAVLRRVVEALNLGADPDFAGAGDPGRPGLSGLSGLVAEIAGRPAAPRTDPASTAAASPASAAALRTLAASVTARREERTFVVTVTARAHDPVKAAQVADAVVTAFVQVQAENRGASTRRIADALDGRLDGLRRTLEEAERRVVDYKAQHAIVAAVGSNVTEQQLVAASARVGELRGQLADAEGRYAQAQAAQRGGDPGAVPEALQSATIGGLRSQFTEAKRREGDLAATLGPRHPSLNEARAQERAVRAQIGAELARIAAALRTSRDRVASDLAAARKTYASLSADVTADGRLSVPLAELERAAQADRAVYESTLARSRQVAGQERIDTADVSVISPAQVPEARSWPPRPAVVLVGALVLGATLGAGGALGLEFARRRRWLSTPFGAPRTARALL